MTTDERPANRLNDMFRQIFGEPQPLPFGKPKLDAEPPPVLRLEKPEPVRVESTPAPQVVQSASPHPQGKTPAEIERLILDAIRKLPGCPQHGLSVTVYGLNPWNAMLLISAQAGPVKDASIWKQRVIDIAMKLRETVELVSE